MAQTEHLPIYKRAYNLCLYFEESVGNSPRGVIGFRGAVRTNAGG
jgi:hypothetical protein